MKHNFFKIILLGYFMGGISAIKAETPTNALLNEAASKNEFYSLSTPVIPTVCASIPVNENEIKAGLLYDAVNQKIIWQKEMNTSFPIASLTKMMVALLAVEDVKSGKYSWDDRVKWVRQTTVGRKKNRKTVFTNVNYSLRDVFKAAMIASNNECAEQLAKYLSNGDLQSTIERMNLRAYELKMSNTFFSNPTGLPAPHAMFDNKSSPADLLTLSLEMLKYDEVIEIASMGYASIENGSMSNVISNHNRLTIEYSGEVDGLKTGYTRRAGFCLVATAAKCDHRLISIVLGCRGPEIRNEVVRDMFNDYYTSISLDKLGSCPSSTASVEQTIQKDGKKGRYVTITERVKKIHVVRKGENISKVARRYDCSTAQLRSWNRRGLQKNHVYAGQKLVIYYNQPHNIFVQETKEEFEADEDKPLLTSMEKREMEKVTKQVDASVKPVVKAEIKQPSKYLYHIVVPGDTLFKISQKYAGITVEELKSLNKISNGSLLKPGTKLKIKVQG
jgi:D-alanyl-D-alanine carboxypeptidase (penicillin-binding protein 5/6)